MDKKYIISLTFEEENLFFKKMHNFRKRNSSSFSESNIINLPLIAPFTLKEDKKTDDIFDTFEEEISSFFIDESDVHSVTFTGLDVYKHYKKYLLYLNPRFSFDFYHCIEALNELKKEHAVSLKKKEAKSPYLIMGKFAFEQDFQDAHAAANEEFWFPVDLNIKSIALFEKNAHHWTLKRTFFEFIHLNEDFSSSEKSSNIKL